MINLRLLFGWIPKTHEYETRLDSLRNEYAQLEAFRASGELQEYLSLEKEVTGIDFARRKKEIMGRRFSQTPEFAREKEYLQLKRKKEIRKYYAIKDSVALKDFLEFDNSYDVKHFHTLENFIRSDEFRQVRQQLGKKKFKTSPEYEKLTEYEALKKSERFKDYFAFKKSADYINFTLLIGSEKIAAYEQLEAFIHSTAFKEAKDYMLLSGKQKYELSEEHKKELRYNTLKNSEPFKWYFKTKDSKKFNYVKQWQLAFSDEFDAHRIDQKKWITRYFWGEALLHDSYVTDSDKQFYTGEGNLELGNSLLKIITRREKVSGKAWNPAIGFYPREFQYSSGIVNTGGGFRQQFGLFEAKIRLNLNSPLNHAFWLVSDTLLPHIDVVRAGKRLAVGNYWGNPNVRGGVDKRVATFSRNRYGADFFIFTLEWSRGKLVWKINGVPVQTSREGIPDTPMFINFSSALYQDVNGSVLPGSVEVDWVRCYKPVNQRDPGSV